MIDDYVVFTGINILLAWSVYVILLTGSLSFANGGFMAVGAYASGLLTARYGWPLTAAIGAGCAMTTLLGILVSLPALRTRGVYLILLTIGLSLCIGTALESLDFVGGVRGMGGLMGTTPAHVGTSVLLVGLALFVVSRTPLQRLLDAVREDESVARSLGVNTTYLKIAAFGAGAAIAAAAGGLYAHYIFFIRPEMFNILTSIFAVLYVILGGVNNLWGPVLGAALMTLLPEAFRSLADWRTAVFGLVIVIALLFRPDGLLSFRTSTARSKAISSWGLRSPSWRRAAK